MMIRRRIPKIGSIFLRNLMIILLGVLLFSSIVIMVYQHQVEQMVQDNVMELNEENLARNVQILDSVTLNLRELAYSVSIDTGVRAFLQGVADADNQILNKRYQELSMEVSRKLDSYRLACSYANALYVYSTKSREMLISPNQQHMEDAAFSEAWLDAVNNWEGTQVKTFFQRRNDRYPYLITFIIGVRNIANPEEVSGFVMVDLDIEALGKVVQGNVPSLDGDKLFIIDESGRMIFSTPYRMLGERDSLPEELAQFADCENGTTLLMEYGREKYVVSCQDSFQEGWRYVMARPYEMYHLRFDQSRFILRVMILLSILLAIVVVALLARVTFRPIERIISAVEKPGEIAGKDRGMQEIERIIASVSHLHTENHEMREKLREKVQQFSIEQVLALQSQMDPHFLYNVLDSFRWMAIDELGEENDLAEMAKVLADFFRLALRRSDYLVPLSSEVEHVRLFLQLYEYRYKGRIQVHYDIPDELMNAQVLKLSVQPIVDNAIKHGLRVKRYMGNIWITARQADGRMIFSVENDGDRIEAKELAYINDRLMRPEVKELDEHIGLINIARRIHLLFGEEYGVRIEETDRGVMTVFVLPLKETDAGMQMTTGEHK